MYTERKLLFFQEMTSCCYPFYFWTYDTCMNLLDSNCPNPSLFEHIFALEHFPQLILEHLEIANRPVILSNAFGLMWAAIFELSTQGNDARFSPIPNSTTAPLTTTAVAPGTASVVRIHIMGPVLITSFSHSHIERKLNQYEISVATKRAMLEQLRTLPVIESNRLTQYILMFHFCVRGEKIVFEDFIYLTPPHKDELSLLYNEKGEDSLLPDTHNREQELLLAIEHGNINYRGALSRSAIAANIKVDEANSLNRYKYSTYRFISYCCKAAQNGGLSRYTAYTLSNIYTEAVDNCNTPSELKKTIDIMYEDYITRVHECQKTSLLPAPLRTCRDYINQNPTGDLSLSKLADMVKYNPYYLSKLWKKETGTSLNQYIKKTRIEYAKLLLTSQENSIQQISEQLHFCSSSHFAEAFNAQVGMMPREYRKNFA